MMSHDTITPNAPRWKDIFRSPRYNRFPLCGGKTPVPSRSFPFLETGFKAPATEDGSNSRISVARRENIKLLRDDSLAYVDNAVNAICMLFAGILC
jgi:hypothetical protein